MADVIEEQEFDFDEDELAIEESENQDELDYEVSTQGTDWTLEVLCSKIEKEDIYVPDFQRKLVWNDVKRSKLIDSFLRGFPIPNIFLYKNVENKLEVIDGQQRLWAVKDFFDNKYALKKVKSEWEGKTFSELSPSSRLKLEDCTIRGTVISSISPENPEIIFRIFERLNTGGVKLNDQEIRNGVWGGKLNEVIKTLNLNEGWRDLLNNPNIDNRFKDVEMILRFFALTEEWGVYHNPMNEFLTAYLSKNRNDEKTVMQRLFCEMVRIIHEEIGKNAFRLEKNINKAFFDAISVGIALCIQGNVLDIDKIEENFEALKKNDELINLSSKSTTGSKTVKRRIEIAYETFKK